MLVGALLGCDRCYGLVLELVECLADHDARRARRELGKRGFGLTHVGSDQLGRAIYSLQPTRSTTD